MISIPTYIINLKSRPERRLSVLNEFSNNPIPFPQDNGEPICKFALNVVNAIQDKNGAIGLWKSIKYIIEDLTGSTEEYILICEDDHQFTEEFSIDTLLQRIAEAQNFGGDILLGGISWCNNAISVNSHLFWVDRFSGLQFVIIFRQFFSTILQASFNEYDCADYKISDLTDKKFVIYPFISVQKDFGYSDITPKNNEEGRCTKLFKDSSNCFSSLRKVENFYKECKATLSINEADYNEISIPTYIINLPDRTDRLEHIRKEFASRQEFSLTIVEGCRHSIGAVGLC